jgi:pimeloyl-ACP methyl ester carboxylesterase
MAKNGSGSDPTSIFITAPDGLRLHVRCYGERHERTLPVICLPGLARTSADFHEIAMTLSRGHDTPRRVLALDYRGRGQSDHDRNADNYSLAVELADVLAVLSALEAQPGVFIGTSRGGILTMLLAAARPTAIAGAVLNDIGPVIEPKGLLRIKSYVGKLPQPKSFEEGAEILRRLFDAQFPKLDSAAWLAAAQRTWQERQGRLVPTYDVNLAKTLKGFDAEQPLPALWKEFDALAGAPIMVIRGVNSDILSEETLGAMRARRPDLAAVVIPDQGHAPLLAEVATIRQIANFVAHCEAARRG